MRIFTMLLLILFYVLMAYRIDVLGKDNANLIEKVFILMLSSN